MRVTIGLAPTSQIYGSISVAIGRIAAIAGEYAISQRQGVVERTAERA
jgi:hypothetical protein